MTSKEPAAQVAERELLLHEFDTVARACLGDDPDATDFTTVGASFNPSTGAMKPRWQGLPIGRRDLGNGAWTPERNQLVELIACTWEQRSLRWNSLLRTVMPPDHDWVEQLALRWPGRFDCEVSCGPGWADLITAVTLWIDEAGEPFKYGQIKEKFGTARLYYDGGGEVAFAITTIAESFVSPHLCEVCGAHGRLIDGAWLRTLCALHEAG